VAIDRAYFTIVDAAQRLGFTVADLLHAGATSQTFICVNLIGHDDRLQTDFVRLSGSHDLRMMLLGFAKQPRPPQGMFYLPAHQIARLESAHLSHPAASFTQAEFMGLATPRDAIERYDGLDNSYLYLCQGGPIEFGINDLYMMRDHVNQLAATAAPVIAVAGNVDTRTAKEKDVAAWQAITPPVPKNAAAAIIAIETGRSDRTVRDNLKGA
jgi:hypothetical protein